MEPIRIYYDKNYCHEGATFDTHSKAKLVADHIRNNPAVALVSPDPATATELALVHDAEYITAVLTGTPAALAESNGFQWSSHLRNGVLATTGGVRDAALHALTNSVASGSLSSGLHHATKGHGRGFCTINGLALGAIAARQAGAHRVLILDLDAHCGGGTAQIINGLAGIEQLDLSVIGFDHYDSTNNAHLVMTNGPEYINELTRQLSEIRDPDGFDLVIYNAGMDVHEEAGGVHGITTQVIVEREHLVMDWCRHHKIPVAFVLAGGYSGPTRTMDQVAELHVLTISAAIGVHERKNSL